jgi:hypothetical protein
MAHRTTSLRYMGLKVAQAAHEAAAALSSATSSLPDALARGVEAYRARLTATIFIAGAAMAPTLNTKATRCAGRQAGGGAGRRRRRRLLGQAPAVMALLVGQKGKNLGGMPPAPPLTSACVAPPAALPALHAAASPTASSACWCACCPAPQTAASSRETLSPLPAPLRWLTRQQ